ncbi:MAG: glucose 1-dehydrogenase [Alphaproteobacteria bacterium]|nr:glucose 1-dehydrogenase [Alphaproteobacteria bacterium]
MGRLNGKVAVITGATSGIGEETARLFAAEGARVVMAGRTRAKGEALARELGGEALFVPCDVEKEADIEALIDTARKRFDRIDCLFNNAGAPSEDGGIEQLTAAGFDACYANLVRSVFLGMKYVAPVMRAQKSGSIINTASVAGHLTGLSAHLYTSAKAAVIMLTKTIAIELGMDNVRVNAISPGGIVTPIFLEEGDRHAASKAQMDVILAGLSQAQPIPRAGLPRDIANAALFLASDDSLFVNAHDLVVDGGMIAGRYWPEKLQAFNGREERLKAVKKG